MRSIDPMLIGATSEAFDDPAWLYELKLDGERAIVYLEKDGTELKNKRNKKMLPVFPELKNLHEMVKEPCILDGEYVVMTDGKPDFAALQRRSLMSNPFRIELTARKYPVSFVAFDVLAVNGERLMDRPLTKRKEILAELIRNENDQIALSRVVEQGGCAFYELAKAAGLEGIVAKKRTSLYYPGKRTKEWIKIKNMKDDDFVVCGWIDKAEHVSSLVLGQYRDGQLVYKGHVTLGVRGDNFRRIRSMEQVEKPSFDIPKGNEGAIWIRPEIVCTVSYMERTEAGGFRHPVFKGLRDDKTANECVETN